MALAQWQTLQQMLETLQSLFEQFHELNQRCCQSTLWVGDSGVTWIPTIQVLETETEIVLQARIPNVDLTGLEIHVSQETVLIQGEQLKPTELRDYFDFEFCPGHFRSIVPLPGSVRPEAAIAQVEGDNLTLILQKSGVDSSRVRVTLPMAAVASASVANTRS